MLAIPAYVSKELDLGPWVGIVMGAFLMAEAVGRLWLGALSDIVGRKPLIILGPLVSGVASILVVQAHDPYVMLAVRILDGLGAAAFWPALFAAVGDRTDESNRSTGMSILNVAYMVGLALGPRTGGWINALYSTEAHPVYHAAFYLAAGIFALTGFLALVLVSSGSKGVAKHAGAPTEQWTGIGPMLEAAKRVWKLLLVAFTTFVGIGMLIPVLELYALDRFGITQAQFGNLFLIPAIVIACAAVPLGRMGDKWGRLTSIKIGVLLCASALWLVPAIHSPYVLAGGAVIVGIGFLLAFPAWMALVADVTDEQTRGSVLGAAGMAQGFGAIGGAVAGGVLYHHKHAIAGIGAHDVPIYLAAAFLTLSFVLTALLIRPVSTGPKAA